MIRILFKHMNTLVDKVAEDLYVLRVDDRERQSILKLYGVFPRE